MIRSWIVALGLTALATAAPAQELDTWELLALDRAAFRLPTVALLPVDNDPGQGMVYGDRFGTLRAVQITAGNARELWRSRPLDGSVLEVLVEDLDGDGRVEIVARTQRRLYVYDERFNQRWENPEGQYVGGISAMAIGNVDDDPAYEIVVLGDDFLDYIDGGQFNREYRSSQTYRSSRMAIGNVDTDFSLEIVLNEGFVVDAVRGVSEWQTEIFGEFIELADIDGDGIDEILGFSKEQPMRIFDADDQQEKPFQ